MVLFLLGWLICISVARAQPDYAPALWNQAYPGHWYTTGNGHSFCVIHDMEGYYEATISYFQQSNTQASAHYCINSLQNGNDAAHGHVENDPTDAPAGEITQMVREQYYAWHVLCWNRYMFGTEHEGFVNSPAWYSEAMYQASAGLQRHLCTTYSIPMDRNHIIGHNEWQNSAWTNWMAVNWPQIDTTCNNHTDPGQYWDWTHFMSLIVGSNTPPVISPQLVNHALDQGSNLTYIVSAMGSTPLSYKWFFNGAAISGATNSSYSLSNIQTNKSGSYYVIVTNAYGAATSSVSFLTVNPTVPWVVVFSDNFDSNSAANWKLFQGSGDGVSDYTTNWAYDYSATTYTFNGATQTIPVAPKTTNGTRLGLKITVNKNDSDAADSGVSLYPKNQLFSNNYALRFDMWVNYNGNSGGGTGSTEYVTCGINHTGTEINWGAGTASSSDGLWFAATGEGGAASDYVAYTGNPTGNPTQLSLAAGGFGVNGAQTLDASDPLFLGIFPSPAYETPGSPGKHWVQGEVSQVNGVVTWRFNGIVVAERTNTSAYTSGNIMIGYMDIFPSIANPPQDNYVIFDNVQVLVPSVAPSISGQPRNQTVPIGTSATFTVTASGVPMPAYQWFFNGAPISGATGTSYTISSPRTTNAGKYSATVSNTVSSVASSNAQLTVTVTPPQFQQITFSNGAVRMLINGPPGSTYAVDISSNLVNWIQLGTFTNSTGPYQFIDTPPTNNVSGFYRVRWLSD